MQRVRVLEVGLDGGPPAVLFDGTPGAGRGAVRAEARATTVRRPHRSAGRPSQGTCAGCKLITACDELKQDPGPAGHHGPDGPAAHLVGHERPFLPGSARHRTTCPGCTCPKQNEYSPAAVRGQAVHAWLEENHSSPLHAACTVWDIPLQPDDWSAGKWHVTGEEALAGSRMLAEPRRPVPLHAEAGQITEVRLEPTLAFHDTDANVIVIAKPDLLYQEDGAWVWREIKTRQRPLRSTADLFRDFPQLALATVLMAENALGGKPAGTRIELELLTPDSGDVLLIDPSDPAEVATARTAVHELAAPWHSDKTAAARPGKHCQYCPVSRWCPDAQVGRNGMTTADQTAPQFSTARRCCERGDRHRRALPPSRHQGTRCTRTESSGPTTTWSCTACTRRRAAGERPGTWSPGRPGRR